MRHTLALLSLGFILNLAACSSSPPAPVIDRMPANAGKNEPSNIKKQSVIVRPLYKAGDWRPDTYTVKKGDNLYSIGLEFGYYYKDIALANNISAIRFVIEVEMAASGYFISDADHHLVRKEAA